MFNIFKKKQESVFYTVNDVMKILQLSRLSIYRYINSWELKSYKIWGHKIKKEDLYKFIEKHKNINN